MPTHKFQLVLQLPEECPLESLDFEEEIAAALDNVSGDSRLPHKVDGNSFGAGTIEFFVYTNRPTEAFELCKPLLESRGLLTMVTAAWCSFADHRYTVIWPSNFKGKFQP